MCECECVCVYSYSSWPPGRLTCVNFLLINVALRYVTLGAMEHGVARCTAQHSSQHSVVRSLAPLADSCAVLRSANMLSCSVESEKNSYFLAVAVAAASILTSLCYKMPNEQTQSATHTTQALVCFLIRHVRMRIQMLVRLCVRIFNRATSTNAKLVINKAHVHFIGFHLK